MKTETFKFSRKATTALLLCTGLVASQPLSLWAENDSGAVQIVQQQKITVKGTVNDAMGPALWKRATLPMVRLPTWMVISPCRCSRELYSSYRT